MIFNKRHNCGLLPFIREDVHGLSPNDPQEIGWEIKLMGVDKQWNKSAGKNVTVAVIDTGCDINHPDIKDNIVDTYNAINGTKDATDDNGHGSHVCGTIAAINNNRGIVGVAPQAKIIAIKALGRNGTGSGSSVAKGIKYAVDNGADIITMSLGMPYNDMEIKKQLKYALKSNVISFCAAGNSGRSVDIMYPAKLEETFSIGAIDKNMNIGNFTCSGESLDFLAPGVDILSIIPGGKYALMTGTSMSNPFAAGVGALYLSKYKYMNNGKRMSMNEMLDMLKSGCIDTSNREKKHQGYGILKPLLQ
jgi:major intracellular serine protease